MQCIPDTWVLLYTNDTLKFTRTVRLLGPCLTWVGRQPTLSQTPCPCWMWASPRRLRDAVREHWEQCALVNSQVRPHSSHRWERGRSEDFSPRPRRGEVRVGGAVKHAAARACQASRDASSECQNYFKYKEHQIISMLLVFFKLRLLSEPYNVENTLVRNHQHEN